MVLAADNPFLDVFGTMLVFLWIKLDHVGAKVLVDIGAINQGSSTL